ncbi:hypothetical protein PVAG01_04874 [Phlyctema vagabunda]|uniref:Rhodopsin domain-containing protein n=1 Tax=Phlyctema vagabunda TaxID=108571 RepID=A0ABR4PJ50_9HELO
MDDGGQPPALYVVPILMLSLAIVTTGLRSWVRKTMIKSFGLDDWLMLSTLACFTVLVSLGFHLNTLGLGHHIITFTAEQLKQFLFFWMLGQIVYIITTIVLKTCISVFLLRIAVSRMSRNIIYGTTGLYLLLGAFFGINIIVQCTPVSFQWDKSIAGGSCRSTSTFATAAYVNGAISATTDLFYALFPIYLIWNLQMDRSVKISVSLILGLGVFSSSVALIRLKYVGSLARTEDYTHDVSGIAIWTTIEPGVGIIAANLACLRPLLRTFLSKLGVSFSTTNAGQPSGFYNTPRSRPFTLSGEGDHKEIPIEDQKSMYSNNRDLELVEQGAWSTKSMTRHSARSGSQENILSVKN